MRLSLAIVLAVLVRRRRGHRGRLLADAASPLGRRSHRPGTATAVRWRSARSPASRRRKSRSIRRNTISAPWISGAEGEHEFVFKNVGDAPLVLTAGPTTCRCTVSEVNNNKLLPGESFKVKVHWKGREVADDYRQTVQIYTNDPGRPTVELAVVGEVAVAVRADPSELVFSHAFPGRAGHGGRCGCCAAGPSGWKSAISGWPTRSWPSSSRSRCGRSRRRSCAAKKPPAAAFY